MNKHVIRTRQEYERRCAEGFKPRAMRWGEHQTQRNAAAMILTSAGDARRIAQAHIGNERRTWIAIAQSEIRLSAILRQGRGIWDGAR